jgi:hypothetical protein
MITIAIVIRGRVEADYHCYQHYSTMAATGTNILLDSLDLSASTGMGVEVNSRERST